MRPERDKNSETKARVTKMADDKKTFEKKTVGAVTFFAMNGRVMVKDVDAGPWELDAPIDGDNFKTWINGLSGEPLADARKAWIYGAKLKAMQPVRGEHMLGEVTDFKIKMGNQTTDLEALPFEKACRLITRMWASVDDGLNPGERNLKIARIFAERAVAAGTATNVDGVLKPTGKTVAVAGGSDPAPATTAPAPVAPKANGKKK